MTTIEQFKKQKRIEYQKAFQEKYPNWMFFINYWGNDFNKIRLWVWIKRYDRHYNDWTFPIVPNTIKPWKLKKFTSLEAMLKYCEKKWIDTKAFLIEYNERKQRWDFEYRK